MFWRKKPLKYDILIPPLNKPVHQLSETEAQAFFDWYMEQLDERTAYLRQYTGLALDYSPESLVPLWKWFLRRAEIENTPAERLNELKKEKAGHPLADTVLKDSARQLSLETEYIIRDIGMYWGQVFVKNHPSIHWGFYTRPKRDMFVNRPLLLGFPNEVFPDRAGVPFEPVHMTHIQACGLFRHHTSKYDLLKIHRIWEEKIVNPEPEE